MGIVFPEVYRSVRVTNTNIISERGYGKEEGSMGPGRAARPDKRGGVPLRGSYLGFLSLGITV
jgi:hypothetical protein